MKYPNWIPKVKFICFDIDGTLYRNVPEIWNHIQSQVYDLVSQKQGWDLAKTRQEFDRLYQEFGSSTKVIEYFNIDAKTFFNKIFQTVDFDKYIKHDQRLFNLIENLRHKYIVGILSNGGRDAVVKKLTFMGLNYSQFKPFLTTYDYGSLKPDPAPFLQVIEDAGVRPEESVYIGDREETDILGAKAVGMRTIMAWGKSKEADLSISTIYDLENYFLTPRHPEERIRE